MRMMKLYHLTLVVGNLAEAVEFYDRLFSPHCFMRGYAPLPLHRDAALLAIADTVVEPMRPLPPEGDHRGTTIYRFFERFGPRVHSLALLVSGAEELAARFESAGVRWTDGGLDRHVFPHPKDFPGLLELADFGENLERFPLADPRLRPQYDRAYWRDSHPLGIAFTSHYTLVVRDRARAARCYVELLDGELLPEQPGTTPGAASSYVAFPDGTIVELAQPVDRSCPFQEDLATVGETWCGLTFRVTDLSAAAAHLEQMEVPIAWRDTHSLALDRRRTFGVHHGFTDRTLLGDRRPASGG